MTNKKIVVIGAGFAGISAATCLADSGFDVTVLEKNNTAGGRARCFSQEGFLFDMGPSWYWMPDVFERYFNRFNSEVSDFYQLERLDPSYTVIFGEDEFVDIPASLDELYSLFESYEKGSSKKLKAFLNEAAFKYEVGIKKLVYKPSRSLTEFLSFRLLLDVLKCDVFTSFHKHIRKFFNNEKLLELMEFPVLFLGALSKNTPALYSLMNYADIKLGTWYPMGGMHKIIEGMVALAESKGVKFHYGEPVTNIEVENNRAKVIHTTHEQYTPDFVIGGADYHHIDQKLLSEKHRTYSSDYWEKRVMAPSCLIYYLGINKKLDNLNHHNLFFDEDFGPHAEAIYKTKKFPENPLFYVSAPSKTDKTVAPSGCENLFILIPIASGLEENETIREQYYDMVMDRLERLTKQNIRDAVVVKKSYAHRDFVDDYNAFKGNAYGLANTLRQTAILKPTIKSKKVKNLYYTGQLTVPGPGVPPSLISGQVVADEIIKNS
ncbi:phytoene desaturase family protein [Fulvivirgaceae bacterium BMA10]|uniref:Phytoene desaturase family protein n=1 Tax=Splendidivirga corallicola TaxID=3051826 RepID=A0ABT8KWT8_9BACT|nr:phytoene desaturase family protein [Fulvivirgaceae bacterium BMA10]